MSFGNRTYTQNIDTLRLVVGFDGRLPHFMGPLHDWTWEASLSIGGTQGTELTQGNIRTEAMRAAVGPSFNYGTAANPDWGCGTGPGDRIPGCIPVNLFGQISGPASAEQKAYLTYDGVARGTNQMISAQIGTSGELFKLLSPRPASLAVGFEYRKVSGSYLPDALSAVGDAAFSGRTDRTDGSQDVHEVFGELSLPLVDGLPFAQVLEFQLAARAFKYSGFGPDWTWKVGGRWKPVQDVTVRGTYSTAFRAPSIYELYNGQSTSSSTFSDPCAGVDSQGKRQPISPWCGAAANNGHQDPVVTTQNRGNPDLHPETARIFTAGLVLEPRFASGLSVAVDVYGVAIDRTVQVPMDPIGSCYPMSADAPSLFCQNVQRDPTTQAITEVLYSPVNHGTERMAGIDLSARYALPTEVGRLGLTFDATWHHHYDLEQVDGSVRHVKGNYDYVGILALFPAWKFNAGASWEWQGLSAGADVRYLGPFTECTDLTGNFGGTFCSFDHAYELRIPAYSAWNARVGYTLESSAGRTELLLGVSNLFDVAPPIVYGTAYPSDPGYDFVGRYFYLRLSHRL